MGKIMHEGISYSGGTGDFKDLGDVALSSVQAGDVSVYNSTTSKWNNVAGHLPVVLTQTLAVGETSLTFTNAAINNNSLIDVYLDPSVGVYPLTQTQSGTSVTFTFEMQSVAVVVKIAVRN